MKSKSYGDDHHFASHITLFFSCTYRCVGNNVQGFSVDYAMPKNNGQAPQLVGDDQVTPLKRMRYSHFGCNVVHEDSAYALGVDIHAVHEQLKYSVGSDYERVPNTSHWLWTRSRAPPKLFN